MNGPRLAFFFSSLCYANCVLARDLSCPHVALNHFKHDRYNFTTLVKVLEYYAIWHLEKLSERM